MGVKFIISLSIPIFTYNLSCIEKSSVHNLNALLSINILSKFDLHNSIRVSFKKSDTFNLTNFAQLKNYILFNISKICFIISLLWGKYMFHDNYFKSLTFLLVFFIPSKHFLLIFFC